MVPAQDNNPEVLELKRYLKFKDLLDALSLVWLDRANAKRIASGAEMVGKVALVLGGGPGVNEFLFEAGAKLIVYIDGLNIGIVRSRELESAFVADWARRTIESLTPKEEWPEWFYHPSGFLQCRGSIKNPAKTNSAIIPMDLAIALSKLV